MEICERILLTRRKLGMSQLDVERLSGLSRNTICNIESGKTDPTIDTLLKLCKVFKVTPNDLLFEHT